MNKTLYRARIMYAIEQSAMSDIETLFPKKDYAMLWRRGIVVTKDCDGA